MEYPSYEERRMSRKWRLVLLITLLATIGAFVPPILSAFLLKTPFVILSGAEWITIISLIVGTYVAGNVYQKSVELKGTTPQKPAPAVAKPIVPKPVVPRPVVKPIEKKDDGDEKHA